MFRNGRDDNPKTGLRSRTERDPVEMGLLTFGVLVLIGALVARAIVLSGSLSSTSAEIATDERVPAHRSEVVADDDVDAQALRVEETAAPETSDWTFRGWCLIAPLLRPMPIRAGTELFTCIDADPAWAATD